jgi:hypothetical protein
MKKIIRYSILLLVTATFFNSCRKEDNSKLPGLTRVPLPLLTAAPSSGTVIVPSTLSGFTGQLVLDMYFKTDRPPQKYDLVVIKNGNKGTIKTLKADISSFPSNVSFTGPELETLFGEPVKTCDYFDVGVDITLSTGEKLLAFPATGASYAAGIFAQPGANTVVRYTTKVEFNAADYAGDFEVVTDEWADYGVGDIVPLTVINPTQVSFKYKPSDPQPIVVTVDPATLKTSVVKQVYGSGYPPGWGFGDISAESVASNDNFVAPCEKILSVKLKHTVAAGSFGEFKIVLKKKD